YRGGGKLVLDLPLRRRPARGLFRAAGTGFAPSPPLHDRPPRRATPRRDTRPLRRPAGRTSRSRLRLAAPRQPRRGAAGPTPPRESHAYDRLPLLRGKVARARAPGRAPRELPPVSRTVGGPRGAGAAAARRGRRGLPGDLPAPGRPAAPPARPPRGRRAGFRAGLGPGTVSAGGRLCGDPPERRRPAPGPARAAPCPGGRPAAARLRRGRRRRGAAPLRGPRLRLPAGRPDGVPAGAGPSPAALPPPLSASRRGAAGRRAR